MTLAASHVPTAASAPPAAAAGRHRILVLSGVWPHVSGNFEAAEVVCHEILRCLARVPEFALQFGRVTAAGSEAATGPALEARRGLEASGIEFLPPITVAPSRPRGHGTALAMGALAPPELLIPGAGRHDAVLQALGGRLPVAVLTIWSELATAVASGLPVPRLAYYGNPDHKVVAAGFALRQRLDGAVGWRERLRHQVYLQAVRRAHLALMRRHATVFDVAANDAVMYRAAGVAGACYLRNMWPAPPRPDWEAARDRGEQAAPLRIVGNIGSMAATGNSFGLRVLATEIVPALRRRLGDGGFAVHLFGGREPHPALARLLEDPHVVRRGFVADIDAEILAAPVFLVANNHDPVFRVGHTRFLHAWSLGACVVTFRGSAEAMPELVDGENALLADDAAGIAAQIERAGRDPALRRRLGRAGMHTLESLFKPEMVSDTIAAALRQAVSGGRSA